MSTMRVSAWPVQFSETGYQTLIDGRPDPLPRYQVEVKNLAEVMTVVNGYKAELAAIDPAQFAREGNLEYRPNGYQMFAKIVQGRAPSGFRKLPRETFNVRRGAA